MASFHFLWLSNIPLHVCTHTHTHTHTYLSHLLKPIRTKLFNTSPAPKATSWMIFISVNGDTILPSCSEQILLCFLFLSHLVTNIALSQSILSSNTTILHLYKHHPVWCTIISYLENSYLTTLLAFILILTILRQICPTTSLFNSLQWLMTNLKQNPVLITAYKTLWSGPCLLIWSHFLPFFPYLRFSRHAGLSVLLGNPQAYASLRTFAYAVSFA